MAKLYFRYSAMNSGKSTALLQVAYNYNERGMKVAVIKPSVDTKGGKTVVSRLGASRKIDLIIKPADVPSKKLSKLMPLNCVLVDEAQFLQPAQVDDLYWFANHHDIPVIAYGLRTDFKTTGFPGASRLLELAHELQELKTICGCGKKATLNARKVNGKLTTTGDQVAIDNTNDVTYESMCSSCYAKNLLNA